MQVKCRNNRHQTKGTLAKEVNMNIQTSNSATMLHQRDYINTYTNSAKNRMVDRLNELQTLLSKYADKQLRRFYRKNGSYQKG